MQEMWDMNILKNKQLLEWLNLQELSPTKNRVGILKANKRSEAHCDIDEKTDNGPHKTMRCNLYVNIYNIYVYILRYYFFFFWSSPLLFFFFPNKHTDSDMYGTLNSATTGDMVKTRQ